jgi:hypothetical protein
MEDQLGNKRISVPCDCHTEYLHITRWTEDKDWWVSSSTEDFVNNQRDGWDIFKHRVSLAWKILSGKEYWFFDIVVSDKNMQELMDFVKENM